MDSFSCDFFTKCGFIKDMRALVVADDLGYCPRRNQAIFELFQSGKISTASLLVTVPKFSAEGALQCEAYAHRLGLHFNLTEGIL